MDGDTQTQFNEVLQKLLNTDNDIRSSAEVCTSSVQSSHLSVSVRLTLSLTLSVTLTFTVSVTVSHSHIQLHLHFTVTPTVTQVNNSPQSVSSMSRASVTSSMDPSM